MTAECPDFHLAAIASRRAAQCYGLQVLVERTNFKSENFTRFVVVAREEAYEPDSDKVSAVSYTHLITAVLCRRVGEAFLYRMPKAEFCRWACGE